MSLAGFYNLAAILNSELQGKITAGTVTGAEIARTDHALELLEVEADELSQAATTSQERMEAEQLWMKIRHTREALGLQTPTSLALLVEDAIKH